MTVSGSGPLSQSALPEAAHSSFRGGPDTRRDGGRSFDGTVRDLERALQQLIAMPAIAASAQAVVSAAKSPSPGFARHGEVPAPPPVEHGEVPALKGSSGPRASAVHDKGERLVESQAAEPASKVVESCSAAWTEPDGQQQAAASRSAAQMQFEATLSSGPADVNGVSFVPSLAASEGGSAVLGKPLSRHWEPVSATMRLAAPPVVPLGTLSLTARSPNDAACEISASSEGQRRLPSANVAQPLVTVTAHQSMAAASVAVRINHASSRSMDELIERVRVLLQEQGIGTYEVFVNGQRIGSCMALPGRKA